MYLSFPELLDSTHPVKIADDAQAYLDPLALMDRQLDNETEVQRRDAAKGRVALDFSLDLALGQMAKLRPAAAADSQLVQPLVRRAWPASSRRSLGHGRGPVRARRPCAGCAHRKRLCCGSRSGTQDLNQVCDWLGRLQA